jgi:hypothetical protein
MDNETETFTYDMRYSENLWLFRRSLPCHFAKNEAVISPGKAENALRYEKKPIIFIWLRNTITGTNTYYIRRVMWLNTLMVLIVLSYRLQYLFFGKLPYENNGTGYR